MNQAGKGDTPRKVNGDKFRANYLRIFKGKQTMAATKFTYTAEMRNAEIAVPSILKTEDGREIIIQSWTPTVSVDDVTTVTLTGTIRLSPSQWSEMVHRASWQQ